jgi:hypothetical protein
MPESSPPGAVFLLGSAHERALAEVFRRVRQLTPERPKIGFTLAALPSPRGAANTSGMLASAFPGARVSRFAVAGEDGATPPDVARAVVDEADVLFFGGGDPVLAARRLASSGGGAWVRAAHERGAVCVGLSAGSIALSSWWASWSDDDPEAPPEIVPCLGVATKLVVDCHSEDDDWAELRAVRQALGLEGRDLTFAGIGIGAALVVAPGRALEWIGKPFVLPREP